MLGATLCEQFFSEYNVFATGNSDINADISFKYLKFDLYSESYVDLISWSEPDIIIHCAAITDGNFCSDNSEKAFEINSFSIQRLLEATSEETKIIYISSDAVFPTGLHLAKETDIVLPDNTYGKSKELGEFLLLNSNRNFNIIRTTIVGVNINKGRIGFVEWILNSIKNKKEISLFEDVVFTPISIWDLAEELKFIINNEINDKILHISGSEIFTKYKFGIELTIALNLPTDKINKGFISDFKERVKRCSDQSLDTTMYQDKYKRKLPNLKDTVQSIKENI